jgi:sec-independent protein translocase protein TatB
MFSFAHVAIIFLIALLVFGPEKLPEIARHVGKALGDFRRASTDFRRVIEQEFAEIERQAREKEEQARLKALEASNPAPGGGAAAASAPAPATESAAAATDESTPPALAEGAPPDAEIPADSAPPSTVPNTSAHDSGHTTVENQAAPADVHPA